MSQSFGSDGMQNSRPSPAQQLADSLDRGETPPHLSVPIRLEREEMCHAQSPANIEAFVPAGDGSYVSKTRFGFSPLGVVIGAATVAGNQARKAKARKQATEQWRPQGRGVLYLTNQRLAINQDQSWTNIWYQDVMQAECDGRFIQLQRSGDPAVRFNVPEIDYLYVMFYWFAYNQVLRPPVR